MRLILLPFPDGWSDSGTRSGTQRSNDAAEAAHAWEAAALKRPNPRLLPRVTFWLGHKNGRD